MKFILIMKAEVENFVLKKMLRPNALMAIASQEVLWLYRHNGHIRVAAPGQGLGAPQSPNQL